MKNVLWQIAILNYLSDCKRHTAQEIATELEISRTTVVRYIHYLSVYYPIYTFHGGRDRGGCRMQESFHIGNKFFTNDEIDKILQGLQLLGQTGVDVSKLIEKFTPTISNK